jgi:hypothetical protein
MYEEPSFVGLVDILEKHKAWIQAIKGLKFVPKNFEIIPKNLDNPYSIYFSSEIVLNDYLVLKGLANIEQPYFYQWMIFDKRSQKERIINSIYFQENLNSKGLNNLLTNWASIEIYFNTIEDIIKGINKI